MGIGRGIRTIVCRWCGAETLAPSRRGPAPEYCSPAHRQAMYRARHRPPDRRPVVPEGVAGALRELGEAVRAAAAEEDWSAARRVLLEHIGAAD